MQQQTKALLVTVLLVFGVGIATAALSNPAPIDGGVPLAAPNGLVVTVAGDTEANLEEFSPASDTIRVETADGNMTVTSSGAADVTVLSTETEGTWSNASQISAGFATITMDPDDKTAVTVGGDIERVAWKDASDVAADDGTADFYYGGASGTSRVTIQGAPPDSQLGAVDADTGELLDVATSTSTGQITFDSLTNSNHTVKLQTSDGAPTVSNPSPTGNLSTPPDKIGADIDDPDFSGDEVNVTITLDGTQVIQQNITSAQRVETSVPQSGQTGGQHEWRVIATDSYGQQTIESYGYAVPDTLFIRNETDASQLVDSPVSVEVSFYEAGGGTGEIVTRTSSDGTVNLTGLPVNTDFIVTANPDSGGYVDRTVAIQNIYEQQSIYLLNASVTETVTTRFILEDPTGQFGTDTTLYVQKPINQSGTTTFRTVHADEFGAEGVTATLERGQRYRLIVENDQGTRQVVGPYRGEINETVTVRPGTPTIPIGSYENGWAANAELNNQTLSYRYSDPAQATDELTVSIYRAGHPDDLLVPNQTYTDLGNVSNTIALNESESQYTWVVRFEATRGDTTETVERRVSNRPGVLPDLSQTWRLITGILLLLLSAGAFSLLNAGVGSVVVAAEGALLWWIGWLDGATTGVLVVIALFVAVMVQLYGSGR